MTDSVEVGASPSDYHVLRIPGSCQRRSVMGCMSGQEPNGEGPIGRNQHFSTRLRIVPKLELREGDSAEGIDEEGIHESCCS